MQSPPLNTVIMILSLLNIRNTNFHMLMQKGNLELAEWLYTFACSKSHHRGLPKSSAVLSGHLHFIEACRQQFSKSQLVLWAWNGVSGPLSRWFSSLPDRKDHKMNQRSGITRQTYCRVKRGRSHCTNELGSVVPFCTWRHTPAQVLPHHDGVSR